jgi:hypothetical protein
MKNLHYKLAASVVGITALGLLKSAIFGAPSGEFEPGSSSSAASHTAPVDPPPPAPNSPPRECSRPL